MTVPRFSAFLFAALAVTSVQASDRDTAAQGLEAARAKWASAAIGNYEISFRDGACYCRFGPYYGPIRNVVRNGKLHASFYQGERRDGYWPGRKVKIESQLRITVDGAFARVERLIATAPEGTYRIEYDQSYGFPALVEFDDPAWEDEQWRMIATDFQPQPSGR